MYKPEDNAGSHKHRMESEILFHAWSILIQMSNALEMNRIRDIIAHWLTKIAVDNSIYYFDINVL